LSYSSLFLSFVSGLDRRATRQRPNDRNQHYCPDESDDYASEEASAAAREQKGEEQTANECADYADDNVTDEPVPTTLHELASKPTSYQTYHQPCHQAARFQIHCCLL
jgi:hypothetical protein